MNENAELQDILIRRDAVKCPKCGHCIPKSREAHSYASMIQRCTNPNRPGFKNYGGRGITICDRWRYEDGFENFLADLGPRPEGTTLDRIDNDGNYEPTNCRWATPREQRENQRVSRTSEHREYVSLKRVRRAKPTTLHGRRRCAEITCLLRLRRTAKAERIHLQAELDSLAPIIPTPTTFAPAQQVNQ